MSKIWRELEVDPTAHPNYTVHQGTLLYKNRLVLPASSNLLPAVLHAYHDSVLGGHSGFLRTYKRLTAELFWPGMKGHVKKYVEECTTCQRNKTDTLRPTGLLQPLPIPDRIWEDISMDFVEGLPRSHGHDAILVVVDRLSKYSHFIALDHPYTAKTIAATFVKEIVRLHGFPRTIVLDRDKIFVSRAIPPAKHTTPTQHGVPPPNRWPNRSS